MHKIYIATLSVCSIFIQMKANQPSCSTSLYSGTISTLRNHQYPITHMLIGGKHSCIKVFKAPEDTNKIITTLTYNPKEYSTYIHLHDIHEINIPYPYATWVYKNMACHHKGKYQYLLIEITWQDKNKPPSTFLIEPKRRLSGLIRKKNEAEYKIPFSGLKKISVNREQK